MHSFTLAVTSLFAAGAVAGNLAHLVPRELQIRQSQAFTPSTSSGSGATCADAFGAGYIDCNDVCYDPGQGEVCCPGGGNAYPCPSDSFCLNVNGLCCPDGLDAATCAAQNGVELPASAGSVTSGSTTAHGATVPAVRPTAPSSSVFVPSTTAVVPTPYPVPSNATAPGPTGTNPPVVPFTGGAASLKAYCGGLVAGLLGVVGMLL
ncbi:MAG: hypothetical protein Q9181_001930 [Wetmoreana brouardii]